MLAFMLEAYRRIGRMKVGAGPHKACGIAYAGSVADLRVFELIDQLVLQRVVRQIAVRRQVHLFHEARAVSAHRLDRKRKCLGDIACGFTLGQLQENLELALRQLLR